MFRRVFEFIADRFFDREETQPKIDLAIKREGDALRLVVTNETQDAACDLKLTWAGGRALFAATLPYDLTGFERKAVLLGADADIPQELALVLVYRDLKGRFFCTRYRREHDREFVEFAPYGRGKRQESGVRSQKSE